MRATLLSSVVRRTEEMLDHFLVYRDAIGVAGAVGLECYGDAALLRSLVIGGHTKTESAFAS
jgi:N-acetylglutamate synthase-like GNAT family acetyltransferase